MNKNDNRQIGHVNDEKYETWWLKGYDDEQPLRCCRLLRLFNTNKFFDGYTFHVSFGDYNICDPTK